MCTLQLTSYVHSSQFAQMVPALYIIVNSAHVPSITALSTSTNHKGGVILSEKHSNHEHVFADKAGAKSSSVNSIVTWLASSAI